MTIKCPLCGEVCESDVEIQVGQRVQCPFCDGKFYYGDEQNADDAGSLLNEDIDSGAGESKAKVRFCAYCRAAIPEAAVFCGKCGRKVLVHDDNGVCTREADKREVKLCGQCGAKIPATASFCPGCGRAVLVEESNEIKATVETYPSAVEPAAEVNSANHGYFKNLLRLIVLSLVLSAISAIVSCIDIRECCNLGRVGCFSLGVASLGIQIWLYVAVTQLKSWARKSFIVFNLIGAVFFVFGIGSGFENRFVFMLSVAVCLIDLYCVYLCFQKEVVAVFKPDSELNDARAVVNTMQCFGFWSAEVLMIGAGVIWMCCIYQGTDAWYRDCTAAAVAGSSSARESLISFVANKLSDQGYDDPVETATEHVDSYIGQLRPATSPSRTRSNAPKPTQIFIGLKFLGKALIALVAIIGGFFAKSKSK